MWWLPLTFAAEGSMTLSPTTVPVDEKVTMTVTYTVGAGGMQAGDALTLSDPLFHGMRWARWGYLQTDPEACTPYAEPAGDSKEPSSAGLVTVSTDGAAELSLQRTEQTGTIHNMGVSTALVVSGELVEGDTVTITIGDDSEDADCGLQSSVRAFDRVAWRLNESLGGASVPVGVGLFAFRAEGEPVALLVSAPSQAATGAPFTVRVAVMDARGNPLPDFDEAVELDGQSVVPVDGLALFEVSAEPGIQRFVATAGGLEGLSNPVSVADTLPEQQIFWGDLHTHHGHHYTDDDGSLVDQNHAYARDVVGLHVGCESVKATPKEIDAAAIWAEQQEACVTYTEDGVYVAMLGFEWMGNEVALGEEGHHNVYYDGCDGPLGYAGLAGLQDQDGDEGLWSFMDRARTETGNDSVSVPHATDYTGYNWNDRDDVKRPLAEIYSEWGASDNDQVTTSLHAGTYVGLAQGHRMGLIGASDNHDGYLGNRWAYKNDFGGLGAYVLPELTRAALFEGLKTRSTYATTGHRPILRFGASDGAEIPMGSVYVAVTPSFWWSYAAETSIERVELLAIEEGGELQVLQTWKPGVEDSEGEHTLDWDGAPMAVWLHAVETDGEEAWSSPVWLSDCDDADAWDATGACVADTGDDSGSDSAGETGGDGGDGGDTGGDEAGTCGNCSTGAGPGLALLALLALRGRRRPEQPVS